MIELVRQLIRKRLEKDFLQKDGTVLSGKIMLISVEDRIYPALDSDGSPTYRTVTTPAFREDSLEVTLMQSSQGVIMQDGTWGTLSYQNTVAIPEDSRKVELAVIGCIPYENIVIYDMDGDEFNDQPRIFCRFQEDGEPFSKAHYMAYHKGNSRVRDPLNPAFRIRNWD